jgi:filamentous hemagglutinin family protein
VVIACALALAGALLPAGVGRAQITLDGSMVPGTAGALTGPSFVVPSTVGRTVGNNLFHSFGQFSLQAGESATFTGPASIGNVISRVTGGQLSSINGLIDTRTFMPSANFFLINPAGVMLGPSASINVGGAVHFSTAGYLCLGAPGCLTDPTAGKLFASLGAESVLTAAAPAAFGFLPETPPASIVVDGSNLLAGIVDPPAGQTISLVGGQIQVTGATLAPPGGRVQLVGVGSAGEVAIPSLDLSTFSALAPITISGSTIDVSAVPGGSVAIRGGALAIDTSTILAGSGTVDAAVADSLTVSASVIDASGDPGGSVSLRGGDVLVDTSSITVATGLVDAPAVAIDLQGTSSVSLSGGSVLMSAASGDGRGGNIQLSAPTVALGGGSVVFSDKAGAGAGGDIAITGGSVTMADGSAVMSHSGAASDSANGSVSIVATDAVTLSGASAVLSQADTGTGAPVSVSGGSVSMDGGSLIGATANDGPGGSVTVAASGPMTLSNASQVLSQGGSGGGGPISVSAGSLAMDGGAQIVSNTGDGPGGSVTVTAPRLTLTGGSTIQSTTFGIGQGGTISVTASQSARFADPFTGINTASFLTPIPDDPTAPLPGSPGEILGQFGSLTVTGGAVIQSGVFAGTVGGSRISINATGPIVLSNGGGIANTAFFGDVGSIEISAPQVVVSNGFISTATLQSGNAGGILINTGALTLTGGGQIVTASIDQASGIGGDVTVNAGAVTIGGSSPSGQSPLPSPFSDFFTDSRSGIFSTAAATGPGGNVTIRAPQIQILNGGTISAASTSESPLATAGNIGITFGDLFSMSGGATISTEAQVADGGNITITSTGSLMLLVDSQIITSVRSGVGGGGNISVGTGGHPVQFLVLNDGGIHADAFGGPGGNISIFATALFSSTPIETAITASSALSSPGIISINAVITDVSGSLAELPSGMLEAAALLRASCTARLAAGKASSFVIAGREGIPSEPGGLLPSALAPLRLTGSAPGAARFLSAELPALRLSYLDPKCGG